MKLAGLNVDRDLNASINLEKAVRDLEVCSLSIEVAPQAVSLIVLACRTGECRHSQDEAKRKC